MRRVHWICFALAAMTLLVYARVYTADFVNYDDNDYVYENPHVMHGLSIAAVHWAFGTTDVSYWHPLTWLSHMLDVQLFGLNPAGHHATNVILHASASVLLFLLLRRMTGDDWRSAVVAALFAWHPLHIESVAWISERKDVLSTFFWILTLMAYVRYATEVRDQGRRTRIFYGLSLLLFVLGLMSKPMVVTLPFVLLLLDFWPLGRASNALGFRRLVLEKVPFFILTVAASAVTYWVQKTGGAMAPTDSIPMSTRLMNAVLAYGSYVSKVFWPSNLAIVYPYHKHAWPAAMTLGLALMLILWTGLLVFWARRDRAPLIGWFWFLGTLVPTIGIVQVGSQSMADRYTYIPSIGFFILVVWAV